MIARKTIRAAGAGGGHHERLRTAGQLLKAVEPADVGTHTKKEREKREKEGYRERERDDG